MAKWLWHDVLPVDSDVVEGDGQTSDGSVRSCDVWAGDRGGSVRMPFFVNSYKSEVIAHGPPFAEVRVQYTFVTGYWTFKAKVLSRCPMIIVEEELNTGYADQTWDQLDQFYSFKLNSKGFRPKQAFYTGRTDSPEYHDLRIETTLSSDYAFLARFVFSFKDSRVEFKGRAATVRFYKSGRSTK